MKIKEVEIKVKEFFEKLPFKKMCENLGAKKPFFAKVAPFANYAVPGIVLVLVIIIAAAGGKKNEEYYGSNDDLDVARFKEQAERANNYKPNIKLRNIPENPASDFKYEISSDGSGVAITEYTGTAKEVKIPSVIEDMPVVEITLKNANALDPNSFEMKRKDAHITYIIVPDSVRKLGMFVFKGMKNLEEIVLSKNLEAIPPCCFEDCTSLKTLVFPNNTLEIGLSAFKNSGIETLDIPDGITFEKDLLGIFYGCKNLVSISLPEGMEKISVGMFSNCEKLKNITFPSSVKKLNGGFERCYSLESIVMNNGLEEMTGISGTAITELIMPDTVKKLGKNGFFHCDGKKLKKIHFSNAIEIIDFYNDEGLESLDSINLPVSLKEFSISDEISIKLKEVIVPKGLTGVRFNRGTFSSKLPLKTQQALRNAGYEGRFE